MLTRNRKNLCCHHRLNDYKRHHRDGYRLGHHTEPTARGSGRWYYDRCRNVSGQEELMLFIASLNISPVEREYSLVDTPFPLFYAEVNNG